MKPFRKPRAELIEMTSSALRTLGDCAIQILPDCIVSPGPPCGPLLSQSPSPSSALSSFLWDGQMILSRPLQIQMKQAENAAPPTAPTNAVPRLHPSC